MVIDFHTHIFPERIAEKTVAMLAERSHTVPSTDATAEGLTSSMKASGVDISVVLPVVTKPSQFDSINAFAAEVNRLPGLISFGGIHPDCEDVEEKLDLIASSGLKGIKLHPDYQGVFIDDERYIRIISYAVKLGLCVVLHAGLDAGLPYPIHCPPDRAAKMLDAVYPDSLIDRPLIVFAHSGGHAQPEEVKKHLSGKNVWFDLAYTLGSRDLAETADVIRSHGAERILFATDSPWSDQARDVPLVDSLGLDTEEREMVLWKNAASLLGMTLEALSEKSILQRV